MVDGLYSSNKKAVNFNEIFGSATVSVYTVVYCRTVSNNKEYKKADSIALANKNASLNNLPVFGLATYKRLNY